MAIRVERATLPGFGVRHDITTAAGRRIGVILRRGGEARDLVLAEIDDPDACMAQVALSDEEADALAMLLGSSAVLSQLTRLTDEVHDIITEQIALAMDSPFVGQRLADIRTRGGRASIVAVIRGHRVLASPDPDFEIEDSDVIVAVGTRAELDRLTAILSGAAA